MFRYAISSLFFVALGAFFFVAPLVRAEIPCTKIMPGQDVPAGYGAPYSTVQGAPFPVITGQCDRDAIIVEAGNWENNIYIYKYGYILDSNTKEWRRFTFRGVQPTGDWFQGHASVSVSRSLEELRKNNYIIAFICESVRTIAPSSDGSMVPKKVLKCGCRDKTCTTPQWQLQTYSIQDTPEVIFRYSVMPPIREVSAMNTSRMTAMPGETIQINGRGFTARNDILIGGYTVKNIPSPDGKTLIFTVPNISYGRHEVFVSNGFDMSAYPLLLVVTKPNAVPPSVATVVPEHGRPGDVITLYGKNFSQKNNEIFTGFEYIPGTPSADGTTLSFSMDAFKASLPSKIERANLFNGEREFPLMLRVINENGISKTGPVFKLIL